VPAEAFAELAEAFAEFAEASEEPAAELAETSVDWSSRQSSVLGVSAQVLIGRRSSCASCYCFC
jgi:hypothetical protein